LKFHNEYTIFHNSEAEFIPALAKIYEENKQKELLEIYNCVWEKPAFHASLGERTSLGNIGGVEINILSPSFVKKNTYEKKLSELFKKTQPLVAEVNETREYANHLSVVMHFQYNNKKVILSGDALIENWKDMINLSEIYPKLLPVNAVKASHHGAKNSFYIGMWKRLLVDESIICVSAGKPCHPSEDFVKDIEKTKHKTLCTNKGNYCNKKNKLDVSPENKFYFETNSNDDDRICCDWIELEILPNPSSKIKFTTGHNSISRHCEN
jgi:hypothetical protein